MEYGEYQAGGSGREAAREQGCMQAAHVSSSAWYGMAWHGMTSHHADQTLRTDTVLYVPSICASVLVLSLTLGAAVYVAMEEDAVV